MSYQSMEEAKLRGEKENIPFWKAIQLEDAQERDVKIEDSWEKMKYMWQSMLDALDAYEPDKVSRSGLVGTEGGLMDSYRETKEPLCGDFVAKVMSNALKMGCNNACMKRIVAAPTAGACGVLPAVLVTYYKEYNVPEEKVIEAMYVAAGLGQIIANRAYLAGASGGCQAEIGSGSGMAAGAICYIKGGDTDQIGHACAMALKNLMGLVCDPVGGLVEVPCVKRNVGGAVNALAAADMALAGITSKIPVDQVIDAMKEVGDKMDVSLRETGIGGVAGTPAAQEVVEKLWDVAQATSPFKRALFLNWCYENKRVLYRIIVAQDRINRTNRCTNSECYCIWHSKQTGRNGKRSKCIEHCLPGISCRISDTDSADDSDIGIHRLRKNRIQNNE